MMDEKEMSVYILLVLRNMMFEKFYTEKNIQKIILFGNKQSKLIDLIDCLNGSFENCVRFSEFHRAVRYLYLIDVLLKSCFGGNIDEEYKDKIDKFLKNIRKSSQNIENKQTEKSDDVLSSLITWFKKL